MNEEKEKREKERERVMKTNARANITAICWSSTQLIGTKQNKTKQQKENNRAAYARNSDGFAYVICQKNEWIRI